MPYLKVFVPRASCTVSEGHCCGSHAWLYQSQAATAVPCSDFSKHLAWAIEQPSS